MNIESRSKTFAFAQAAENVNSAVAELAGHIRNFGINEVEAYMRLREAAEAVNRCKEALVNGSRD